MKKSFLTLVAIITLSVASAQTPSKPDSLTVPKDTTIAITMHIDQFRQLLSAIDANIDSKKITKDLLEFLQKSAQIVQPADKPKKP